MFMKIILTIATGFVLVLTLAPPLSLLLAVPVWFIWNLTVPGVFGLPEITYWQAYGLTLLSFILVKGNSS